VGPFLLPDTGYEKDAHLSPYIPNCKTYMILCRLQIYKGVSVESLKVFQTPIEGMVVEMLSGQ
jgi:hypothetical protein